MDKVCVGVDIGGTTVKLGVFSIEGKLLKKWEIDTNQERGVHAVLAHIAKEIKESLVLGGYTLDDCVGIGMGLPGPVLPDGYVGVCVNLGWKEIYPTRILSEMMEGMPVCVGNDANVAALGEAWQGGAKEYENVVMITLGTGVGGGVILGGKIVAGQHGLGGEVGHMHVRESEKEACNCGGHGCLEQISSATGIVREAKRFLARSEKASSMRYFEALSAKDVLDCAKAGDKLALEVIDVVVKYLGIAIAHVALTIDPDVFVIGGGVSKAGIFLVDKIKEKYTYYMPISTFRPDIVLATLGNDAGIYGAAKMVL